MPTVEELPTTAAPRAPGWAYVPDTGFDPSKAAINPAARKRNAGRTAQTTAGAHEQSSRQRTAIQRRLQELDRDNYKDVHIPIPSKGKEPAARAPSSKTASAVKKILQSQKTFANYLTDEEALASSSNTTTTATARTPASKVTKVPAAKGKRSSIARAPSTPSTSTPAPTPKPQDANQEAASATPTTDIPHSSVLQPNPAAPQQSYPYPPHLDPMSDPLLMPRVEPRPSDEVIEELLSQPHLSYQAARAAPPAADGPPRRQFCEMCGYWGLVLCMQCKMARVCDLECLRAHQDSRCIMTGGR